MKLLDLLLPLINEFLLDGDTLGNVIKRNKMNTFLLVMNFIMLAAFVFMFEQAVKNHDQSISVKQSLKETEEKFNKGEEIREHLIKELNIYQTDLDECTAALEVSFKSVNITPVKPNTPVKGYVPLPNSTRNNSDIEDKLKTIRDKEY